MRKTEKVVALGKKTEPVRENILIIPFFSYLLVGSSFSGALLNKTVGPGIQGAGCS